MFTSSQDLLTCNYDSLATSKHTLYTPLLLAFFSLTVIFHVDQRPQLRICGIRRSCSSRTSNVDTQWAKSPPIGKLTNFYLRYLHCNTLLGIRGLKGSITDNLKEIKVNWAYQSNNQPKEDTSNHFHIFVGDLSNEVNDEVLLQAFSAFGSVSEARVMWDMKTGRSRGYGFVAFRDREQAEKALSSMDGEWLGSRAIRCNWANQKGQPSISQQQAMSAIGMTPTTPFGHHHFPTHGVQSYEMVVQQTPQWQTTCYVGNLTPYTSQNDLVPLFQNYGYVVETRFQSDRGFAFVKMDTHENAAMAICQLSGYSVNGRPLKCSVSTKLLILRSTYSLLKHFTSGAKTVLLPDNLMATLRNNPLTPPDILLKSHPPIASLNTAEDLLQ